MDHPPAALHTARHRPFWRRLWVLLIASCGATSYLLLSAWIMRTQNTGPYSTLDEEVWAGISITIGTWALVAWYAHRWAAMPIGGWRLLAILCSPLLFILGLFLWAQVAPDSMRGLNGDLGTILLVGPPWFGMLLLTYMDVLWPRWFVHRTPHEPPA